jgi:hypothetical protein
MRHDLLRSLISNAVNLGACTSLILGQTALASGSLDSLAFHDEAIDGIVYRVNPRGEIIDSIRLDNLPENKFSDDARNVAEQLTDFAANWSISISSDDRDDRRVDWKTRLDRRIARLDREDDSRNSDREESATEWQGAEVIRHISAPDANNFRSPDMDTIPENELDESSHTFYDPIAVMQIATDCQAPKVCMVFERRPDGRVILVQTRLNNDYSMDLMRLPMKRADHQRFENLRLWFCDYMKDHHDNWPYSHFVSQFDKDGFDIRTGQQGRGGLRGNPGGRIIRDDQRNGRNGRNGGSGSGNRSFHYRGDSYSNHEGEVDGRKTRRSTDCCTRD